MNVGYHVGQCWDRATPDTLLDFQPHQHNRAFPQLNRILPLSRHTVDPLQIQRHPTNPVWSTGSRTGYFGGNLTAGLYKDGIRFDQRFSWGTLTVVAGFEALCRNRFISGLRRGELRY
jgi:hypothetical protein